MVTLGVPVPEIVADPAAMEPPDGLACATVPPASRLARTISKPRRPSKFFAIFLGIDPGESLTLVMVLMKVGEQNADKRESDPIKLSDGTRENLTLQSNKQNIAPKMIFFNQIGSSAHLTLC
jgi:hypothetical protein